METVRVRVDCYNETTGPSALSIQDLPDNIVANYEATAPSGEPLFNHALDRRTSMVVMTTGSDEWIILLVLV